MTDTCCSKTAAAAASTTTSSGRLLREAVLGLPRWEQAAFRYAYQQKRAFATEETFPPTVFVQCEGGGGGGDVHTIHRAARRLTAYWRWRWQLFYEDDDGGNCNNCCNHHHDPRPHQQHNNNMMMRSSRSLFLDPLRLSSLPIDVQALLKTGYISFLPDDAMGRPVVCFDASRLVTSTSPLLYLRATFYLWSVLCTYEQQQRQQQQQQTTNGNNSVRSRSTSLSPSSGGGGGGGYRYVGLIILQYDSFLDETVQTWVDMILEAFPIHAASLHVLASTTCTSSPSSLSSSGEASVIAGVEDKNKSISNNENSYNNRMSLLQQRILPRAIKVLGKLMREQEVKIHVKQQQEEGHHLCCSSSSSCDFTKDLEPYGLLPSGLPTSVGGSLRYEEKWNSWLMDQEHSEQAELLFETAMAMIIDEDDQPLLLYNHNPPPPHDEEHYHPHDDEDYGRGVTHEAVTPDSTFENKEQPSSSSSTLRVETTTVAIASQQQQKLNDPESAAAELEENTTEQHNTSDSSSSNHHHLVYFAHEQEEQQLESGGCCCGGSGGGVAAATTAASTMEVAGGNSSMLVPFETTKIITPHQQQHNQQHQYQDDPEAAVAELAETLTEQRNNNGSCSSNAYHHLHYFAREEEVEEQQPGSRGSCCGGGGAASATAMEVAVGNSSMFVPLETTITTRHHQQHNQQHQYQDDPDAALDETTTEQHNNNDDNNNNDGSSNNAHHHPVYFAYEEEGTEQQLESGGSCCCGGGGVTAAAATTIMNVEPPAPDATSTCVVVRIRNNDSYSGDDANDTNNCTLGHAGGNNDKKKTTTTPNVDALEEARKAGGGCGGALNLVEKESPWQRFLSHSCSNGTSLLVADEALQLLARWWDVRKQLFGKNFLLPMTQTGEGALGRKDIALLRSECFIWLPKDKHGRCLLYLDLIRALDQFDECSVLRCAFYALHVACENTADGGLTVLCPVTIGSGVPEWKGRMQLIHLWGVFPISLLAVHFVHDEPTEMTVQLPQIDKLQRLYGLQGHESKILFHRPTSTDHLLLDLQTHGFSKECLPLRFGGAFDSRKFSQYLELRVRIEWDVPAGTRNNSVLDMFEFSKVKQLSDLSKPELVERKRRMNILHTRRKRDREQMEESAARELCQVLSKDNSRLREGNAQLELILNSAKAEMDRQGVSLAPSIPATPGSPSTRGTEVEQGSEDHGADDASIQPVTPLPRDPGGHKRAMNRLYAQRKRERERSTIDSLIEDCDALYARNRALLVDNIWMQDIVQAALAEVSGQETS